MTDEEATRILALRAEGVKIGTIARIMGKNDGNLRKWVARREEGFTPPRTYTDEDLLTILRMTDEGYTSRQIAETLNTTRNAVLGLIYRIKKESADAEAVT